MNETVNSRSLLTAFSAVAFIAGAILALGLPAPLWARGIGIVFALFGAGFAYRWWVPVDATLIVDQRGIRWCVGKRLGADISWIDIRRLHHSSDDDTFSVDVGKTLALHIPMLFLRSPSARSEFLQLVAAARPDLEIASL